MSVHIVDDEILSNAFDAFPDPFHILFLEGANRSGGQKVLDKWGRFV
jgi:hypothetical protein